MKKIMFRVSTAILRSTVVAGMVGCALLGLAHKSSAQPLIAPPTPTFTGIPNPTGGFWDKASVSLATETGGAEISYTINSGSPTPYTAPFDLTAADTLRAIAAMSGVQSAVLDTIAPITPTKFRFTVPKGATVFVGVKDQTVDVAGNFLKKHYVPFTERPYAYVDTVSDSTVVWAYNVTGDHNYRISQPGKLTHVGRFTPSAAKAELTLTATQLASHPPREIDHDVNSLNGRNMADVYLNINAQGHLRLPRVDTSFQLINLRNWQAINDDVNNYFIEPDFHYVVLNEQGEADTSVVSISSTGLMTAKASGSAIVLITYDAMMCAHTTNVGSNGNAFFGALWSENTGVFVVSVGAPASGIASNMTLGEYWSTGGTDKRDSTAIDAEMDVLYYEASTGGFGYTFRPDGVAEVTLAQPRLGDGIAYGGFSTEGVTANADGSYTVRLVHGRNIVKLRSASGGEAYQVLSAKPVTYTIGNVSRPGEVLQPGDEFSVRFATLYHPCNKLSGIYNMSAGIQYTGFDTDFPLILGPGQYTFASRAQEYKRTIPVGYVGDEVSLTHGVLRINGFGSHYGAHRDITLQNGVAPNLNAGVRGAYLGSLPDIHLRLTDIPSTPASLSGNATKTQAMLTWTASVDNDTVRGYNVYVDNLLLTPTPLAATAYTVDGLEAGTEYTFAVEAIDSKGLASPRATLTLTTLPAPATPTGVGTASVLALHAYPNPLVNEQLIISNEQLKAGDIIKVYSISGALVKTFVAAGAKSIIDLSALPTGTYIVKAGNRAAKVAKLF